MTNATGLSPQSGYTVPSQPEQRVNGMAVSAFVLVFFASVVGLVLGYVALNQVRRTGESGYRLALSAVILGWVFTGVAVLVFGLLVVGEVVLTGRS